MFRPVFAAILSLGCFTTCPQLLAQKSGASQPVILKPPPLDTRRAPSQQNEVVNRSMYITGKVQLDDGTAPPQSIVIEKLCGGSRSPVAYTDLKGHFSFQVGGMNAVMPDASESWSGFNAAGQPTNNVSGGTQQSAATSLASCELIAVLPGYRSDVSYLGQHRQLDNPDIGTLILHRLTNVPGTTISATTINAPKDALKAFNKGLDNLKKAKPEAAEKEFSRAVELHPTFAAAWFQLGHLLSTRDTARSRDALQHSIQSDGKYVSPYLDLALLEIREKQWPAALAAASKGVHLDPVDFPQLYFYKAVAEYNTNQLDEAEKSARQAEKIDVEHRMPKIQQLLGIVLMDKQDYPGAAEHLRSYLKLAPDSADAPALRTQLSQLEKVTAAASEQPKQ